MRVLLLPSSYPPVLGGVQTVAHTLARNLFSQGHDVRVVTNRYPRFLPAREVIDGVPVQRWLFLTPNTGYLKRGRLDLFLGSLYFCPVVLARLVHLMQTFRPEVVNVHFPDAQVPFVLWLRRRFSFRLVVSMHGDEIERWFVNGSPCGGHFPQAATRHLRSILRRGDAVTACSRHLLERAIQLEPSVAHKGHVIYNGVDPKRFKNKTAYRHPQPYILAYGRLIHKKGFDMLLTAFTRAIHEYNDVDLILAGDGEERKALEALASRLGLDGRVHFFGRASRNEVVRLLNGCLFVIVPSRREPFGIVALEALAAGKPVLATRVGGLEEFLTSFQVSQPPIRQSAAAPSPQKREADERKFDADVLHRTLLVEATIEGLASGLGQFLHDRDNFSVGAGSTSRQIQARHSWKTVVAEYERILSEGLTNDEFGTRVVDERHR